LGNSLLKNDTFAVCTEFWASPPSGIFDGPGFFTILRNQVHVKVMKTLNTKEETEHHMGKKKKRGSNKPAFKAKQKVPQPKKRSKYPLLALSVGVALLITGGYFLSQGKDSTKPSPAPEGTKMKKEDIRLRETRPTLSPQRFRGNVKRAYQIAREIPEVLDQLYCYCRCLENFNHKNLLSCFVSTHAST
jgi:hypothetical protein